ncbi:hypothetical protein QQP08_015821 [Theobroma cacao]|nr:hypothetical protein QQP08_015821 [Theobroma cacao]
MSFILFYHTNILLSCEKLVEFGIGNISNSCVDPANGAIITQCDGIPLAIQCLSSPVRNTVNYALGAFYYLCNKANREEILKPEVVDVIERYAASQNVSFSNLAKAFLDKHVSKDKYESIDNLILTCTATRAFWSKLQNLQKTDIGALIHQERSIQHSVLPECIQVFARPGNVGIPLYRLAMTSCILAICPFLPPSPQARGTTRTSCTGWSSPRPLGVVPYS